MEKKKRLGKCLTAYFYLIVFCLYLEVSLGMVADWTNLGGFLADDDVSAVAALPDNIIVL